MSMKSCSKKEAAEGVHEGVHEGRNRSTQRCIATSPKRDPRLSWFTRCYTVRVVPSIIIAIFTLNYLHFTGNNMREARYRPRWSGPDKSMQCSGSPCWNGCAWGVSKRACQKRVYKKGRLRRRALEKECQERL